MARKLKKTVVDKQPTRKGVSKTATRSAASTKVTGRTAKSKVAGAAANAAQSGGPVTLAEARKIALAQGPQTVAGAIPTPAEVAATHKSVAQARQNLKDLVKAENERRIREYATTIQVMKNRGVRSAAATVGGGATAAVFQPLQILAEGDSWFDYPVPFFGGGIIPRLQSLLGVPILSLAKAGEEVRNMLGVDERKIIMEQLRNGSPAGGRWDALLFSGGGNDVVGNPLVIWIQDFNVAIPPADLIDKQRFDAVLEMVRAGYEDLIKLRDTLSPTTQLIFHGYDFVIPDGRGVCGFGPWMKPSFDLRGYPPAAAGLVVKAMLQRFAAILQSLAASHSNVTFINTQGTLAPVRSSWHNELHPSKDGFNRITAVFQTKLRALFPGRVI